MRNTPRPRVYLERYRSLLTVDSGLESSHTQFTATDNHLIPLSICLSNPRSIFQLQVVDWTRTDLRIVKLVTRRKYHGTNWRKWDKRGLASSVLRGRIYDFLKDEKTSY